jgi:hypothetical protein
LVEQDLDFADEMADRHESWAGGGRRARSLVKETVVDRQLTVRRESLWI